MRLEAVPTPRDLDRWLAKVDATDARILGFASELAELEQYGLAPRHGAVLLLRAVSGKEAEVAVERLEKNGQPREGHHNQARPADRAKCTNSHRL